MEFELELEGIVVLDEGPFPVALDSEADSPEDFTLNSGGGTYSAVSVSRLVPKSIIDTHPRCGVHAGNQLGSITVVVVVIQQELSSFLIQSGFRVGVYKETFHGNKNMANAIARLPVFLQRIDTNLAR